MPLRPLVRLLLPLGLLLPVTARAAEPVDVLYAGSLVGIMEHSIGPAFHHATGNSLRGVPGGSRMLMHQIHDRLRQADVFISANPALNKALEGASNGDRVRWTIQFAHSPLVLGVRPHSRAAQALADHSWTDALARPGMRIGRTDPKLDPKGALTIALVQQAAQTQHQPGLVQAMLGNDENPSQILPEETLVGRLQSGALDVGFFYRSEIAGTGLQAITVPDAPEARYTITILHDAPHGPAAARFVAFLLGPQGTALLRQHGLDTSGTTSSGDRNAIPAPIRQQIRLQ